MNILELLCGWIPESIFFSLFLIIGKGIKDKRVLFVIMNIILYTLVQILFYNTILIQIFWYVVPILLMNLIYKNKNWVIDVMMMNVGMFFAFIVAIISIFIQILIGNIYITTIINKIILISLTFLFKNSIVNIYKFYKQWWNHKRVLNKPIISLTLRNWSLFIMNILLVFGFILLA